MPWFTVVVRLTLLGFVPSYVEQNAALFAAIRRWRRKAARYWSKTPFLDVRFNEDEPVLTKIDVHSTRAICTDGREKVLRLQPVRDIIQFLAVPSKEDRARSWSISNTNNITLVILGAIA